MPRAAGVASPAAPAYRQVMSAYRPQASDTNEAVDRLVFDGFRAMAPEQRLRLCSQASLAVERLSIDGLRLRFPAATEEELRRRAGALRLGAELTRRAFGIQAEDWLD
jgi:hypothetical protein